MKYHYLKIFIIFIIFIDVVLLNAQEPKEEKKTVKYTEKWTKIEGVAKYRLEIYDIDNKPIKTIETEENEVEIELLPGKYKKRLGLINPFNQIFLYTDWKTFEIIKVPIPRVAYIEKKPIKSDKSHEEIQISVNGIVETTKIYLKDKNNQMIHIKFKQIDTNRIILEINPQTLSADNYDIVIKNSEKKFTEIPNAIQIQQKKSFISQNWKYLIPGIPQKERKQDTKGNILQWGFVGSLLSAGYFYRQVINYQKQYDNLLLIQLRNNNTFYLISPQFFRNTDSVLFLYQQTQEISKIEKKFHRNANAFYYSLGLTALFYSYHLIDVYYYEFYLNPSKKEVELMITIPF
jgi:hypothetical protein